MARKLVVEVLADVTSFSRNLKEATVVSEQFSSTVTSGTKAAAQAVVAASVKTTESLRAQAVAYREIAAAAEVGSQEQIAAARLAEKAELRLAAAMGVVSAEATHAAARTSGAARELERAGRGALTGTGLFHGLGRSLVFASGGFLAFEGVTRFLEESIKTGQEAVVTQRSLAAQMKTSGESFTANQEAIDKAGLSLARFGFTSESADQALVVLDRATGNISQSQKLLTVSADLARAKNLDLAVAANVVAKVFGGQTTALRRAVPGLDKNAKGWDLIREAQARLAGQARAATTPQEKFAAELFNTEKIVGTALLPTFNKYLGELSTWLERMNRSGKLQRDVNQVVGAATGVINAAAGALKALNAITGSTADTLKVLLGAFAAFKALRLVAWFDGLTGAIKGAGAAATVAEGETAALSTSLSGLTAAPWVITILVAYKDIKDPGSILGRARSLFDFVKKGSPLERALENLPGVGPLAQAVRQGVGAFGRGGPAGGGGNLFSSTFKLPSFGLPAPVLVPHDLPTHAAALPIVGRAGLSPMQRAQLALSAAELTKSTKDNLAALVTQRELLAKAITTETARLDRATSVKAAKKFADNLQKLQGQEAAVLDQIASISKQRAGRTPTELAAQRNTWFDNQVTRMLGRVQDIATVGGQITRLQQISGLISRRIAVTKDITRKLNLEDQVLAILQTIKQDRVQLQQDAVDALSLNVDRAALTATMSDDVAALQAVNAKLAEQQKQFGYTADRERQMIGNLQTIKADREQIAQAAHDALSARQFRALGLGATGQELPPTIKALQKQASEVRKALGSMADAKTRQTLAGIGRVLGGGIGKVTDEVKAKIKELLDAFGKGTDPLAGLRQVSSKRLAGILAAGTGLGAQGQRTLAMNIAGAEIQPVHVHVHLDGREVATVVSKQQARTRRRTAQQTSGFRG